MYTRLRSKRLEVFRSSYDAESKRSRELRLGSVPCDLPADRLPHAAAALWQQLNVREQVALVAALDAVGERVAKARAQHAASEIGKLADAVAAGATARDLEPLIAAHRRLGDAIRKAKDRLASGVRGSGLDKAVGRQQDLFRDLLVADG